MDNGFRANDYYVITRCSYFYLRNQPGILNSSLLYIIKSVTNASYSVTKCCFSWMSWKSCAVYFVAYIIILYVLHIKAILDTASPISLEDSFHLLSPRIIYLMIIQLSEAKIDIICGWLEHVINVVLSRKRT